MAHGLLSIAAVFDNPPNQSHSMIQHALFVSRQFERSKTNQITKPTTNQSMRSTNDDGPSIQCGCFLGVLLSISSFVNLHELTVDGAVSAPIKTINIP